MGSTILSIEKIRSREGDIFENAEVFEIHSPQLKKEARNLVLDGHTEDGGFSRVGREIGEKWYEYEKGDENRPDKLEIKNVKPEEIQRRKEQMKRNREELEKKRKEFEQQKEEWEKSFEKSEKKCAFCEKVIDSDQGIQSFWSIGQTGKEKNRLYFCATGNCLQKHTEQKNRNRNDNSNNWKKCDKCDSTPSGGYWEYLIVDGKTYCTSCADKLPKKSETELEQIRLNALKSKQIEQERTKLRDLKSKLQNSSDSAEKERLQTEIDEIKNHLNQENKNNSKNNSSQSNQPNEGHGKLFLIGAVVFIPVVILVSILVVRIRKDNKRRK